MINLFNINNYTIDTSKYDSLLNDSIVEDFENKIASYVGAKYACSVHSATMAIFLSLIDKKNLTVEIPTIIPPVVPNAILCAGQKITYRDDIDWVGSSYVLHDFGDYKIIDSAQQLEKNQFSKQANDSDLMIFSFYPTKPVGSVDGLERLAPNPEDQAYALMYGELACPTTMSAPFGDQITPVDPFGRAVDGAEYLVPNPDALKGYALILSPRA